MRSSVGVTWLAAAVLFGTVVPLAAQAGPSPKEVVLKKLTGEIPDLVETGDKDSNGGLNLMEFGAFYDTLHKRVSALLDEADPKRVEKREQRAIGKYDKNADGKIDETEAKAREEDDRRKNLKGFDWNRDGKLSEKEATALAWAKEGEKEYRWRKIDTDSDGKVSTQEILAAIQDLSGIKVKAAP